MKRQDKLRLLSNVLEGNTSPQTKTRLQQAQNKGLIVLFVESHTPNPQPDDVVCFEHMGQSVTMPLKDVSAFYGHHPISFVVAHVTN